jgi:YD repeat-containing protein
MLTTTTASGTTNETISYDRGEPTAVTNAVGRTTQYFYDAVGRLVMTTAPDGSTSQTVYSPTNLTLKTIDAHGNATVYGYASSWPARTTTPRSPDPSASRPRTSATSWTFTHCYALARRAPRTAAGAGAPPT